MAPLEPKLIKPRPFSQASRRDPAEDLIGTEMWRFDGHRTPELKNDIAELEGNAVISEVLQLSHAEVPIEQLASFIQTLLGYYKRRIPPAPPLYEENSSPAHTASPRAISQGNSTPAHVRRQEEQVGDTGDQVYSSTN